MSDAVAPVSIAPGQGGGLLHKLTTLSKQSAIYGLGTFLNQGIGFLLIPVYTRFLSTEDYGVNASVTAVMGILAIVLTLSLETAVTRFYYDLDRERDKRAYFGAVWLFLHLFGLAVTVLLDLTGEPLFGLLFRDVPFEPCGRLALWSSFLVIPSVLPTVLLRVRERPRTYVALSVSQFLLRVLLNILFVVYLRQGVVGIFRSYLVANLVYAVPYTWLALRDLRLTSDLRQLGASLAFALPFVPHRLSTWVLNVSDRILLERFVSLNDLGIYSLGYRFGMILATILDAVNLAWSPFYFKTAKEEGGEQALARLTTYWVFALSFLTLGNVLLSREVVTLVAAPRFHAAYRIVPLISFAYALHGVYLIMVSGLLYTKKTKRIPLYTAVAAVVNVGANLLLIPRFGFVAAAWTTLAAFLLRSVLIGIESVRAFPIPYEFRRLSWALGLALLLCAGWFVDTGRLWTNLGIRLLFITAYPLAIRFGGLLYPEELAGLRTVRRRLAARLGLRSGRSHV